MSTTNPHSEAPLADGDATDLSDSVRRNARLVGYLDVPDGGVIRNRNTPDEETVTRPAGRRMARRVVWRKGARAR